jgi:hypothetical protein
MDSFDARHFAEDLEKALLDAAKEQLREQFSSFRHPKTGEFPTVIVRGDSLDDLRLSIEGSPEVLAIVQEHLSSEDQENISFEPVFAGPPRVFLCYGSEDYSMAERLARALMKDGIDIWWDNWEISSGDSHRQKIDSGLGNCTHFLALLTPASIEKPWVKLEMDAAYVKRVRGQAKFIPLRYGITPLDLPPLLAGMQSPDITDQNFEDAVRDLVNDIHGVSQKPQLGSPPVSTALPATEFSQIATAISKIFVEQTKTAMFGDPQKRVEDLAIAVEASEDDVEDALRELRDYVTVSAGRAMPKGELFAEFDKYFMDWSPEFDALKIAADLVNDSNFPHDTAEVAGRYGWETRRINCKRDFPRTLRPPFNDGGCWTDGSG